MRMQIRQMACGLAAMLALGVSSCEIRSGDEPEWAYHVAMTGRDVHHFINGLGVYTEAHAAVTVAASSAGFYVFYREDVEGTSDWGWQQTTSVDDADNFLNKTGPHSGDPVDEAILAYKKSGELHLFHRGSAPVGSSWGWKQVATLDDMHSFVNGVDSQEEPKDGMFGGLSADQILTYYRVDVSGTGDWRWKISDTVDDVSSFLNGDGDYGDPVKDARILATSDGVFYVFYKR